jgi:prevent-host-death family protein
MNIAPLADVKARFSAYIRRIQDEPVIVTKNGRPVAILLGISDKDDLERIMLATSRKFQALLENAERRIQETGGISHDDAWAQLDAEAEV